MPNPCKHFLLGIAVLFLALPPANLLAKRTVSHTFYYQDPSADAVEIIGQFNDWKGVHMKRDENGLWSVALDIIPGSYPYKLRVDGEWITDPGNPELTEDKDGNINSLITIKAPFHDDISYRLDSDSPDFTPPTSSDSSSEPIPTEEPSLAKPSGKSIPFAGHNIFLGRSNILDIPVEDSTTLKALKTAYGHTISKIRLFIAVPNDFDPQKSYPIILATATTDGTASSVDGAEIYLEAALMKNAILVAVDGGNGKPTAGKGDTPAFRWALNEAALKLIQKEWLHSRDWPIITAGISGGAGYASYNAIMLVTKRYPTIGMFLANSGWNPANFPGELRRAPTTIMRKIPIFMTAGTDDTIATKSITDQARADIEKERFRNVRYESFSGGHELSPKLFAEAIDWFQQIK